MGLFGHPVSANSQPKSYDMILGLWSLSTILHPTNEPGKLPQWLCHDDNTINIVVLTLIITITYSRVLQPKYINTTQYGQKYALSVPVALTL